MGGGDFRKGPFHFNHETDEDAEFPILDPFSIEPPQMAVPDKDLNKANVPLERLAKEVRPSHLFRFLDYLYSNPSTASESSKEAQPEQASDDLRRHGKLNWRY